MICPECGGKTGVAISREVELNTYRQRKCKECGYTFYTEETEIDEPIGLRYWWARRKYAERHTSL